MTHRSGLAYGFSVTGPLGRGYGGCRSARIRTAGWPSWPTFRWRISPATRLTYSHATDVLGIALSRIEGKSLSDVLAERIFAPLGMADTGFSVSADGRRRAATMYKLDDDYVLQHDVMGPAPITDPPFCTGAPACGRRSTTTCGSPGCCSAAARSTASGCSPRSRCG